MVKKQQLIIKRRRKQRGAVLFVVVMIITLLSAVGIIAARSLSLVDSAAGYSRQAQQTAALGEYGAMLSTAHLSAMGKLIMAGVQDNAASVCQANRDPSGVTYSSSARCISLFPRDIEAAIQRDAGDTSRILFAADTLGINATIAGDFLVELTEIYDAPKRAGFECSQGKQATLTVYASTGPTGSDLRLCSAGSPATFNRQTFRARIEFPVTAPCVK